MLFFLIRRFGIMLLTAICLTFVVFFLTNLYPNLEKVAKLEGTQRMTDVQVASYLKQNGYTQSVFKRYGQWLGVMPGFVGKANNGKIIGRCIRGGLSAKAAPRYCGILQGNFGYSIVFQERVGPLVLKRLGLTGFLMMWVLIVMIPSALVMGILAGMREGTKLDRILSIFSIVSTSTPEYVSGVILIVVFSSRVVGLRWFVGSSTEAMYHATFSNFTLPVVAVALYGMGYIARMTRASMAEVMTAQYIRTARLKGVSFRKVVLKHALRNALIAPFTVIMLQFPWLLTGVVVVETLFNYKGLGWLLVQAASNNDIELLQAIGIVSVVVVLLTQLISDIGYVYLNPRIRVT